MKFCLLFGAGDKSPHRNTPQLFSVPLLVSQSHSTHIIMGISPRFCVSAQAWAQNEVLLLLCQLRRHVGPAGRWMSSSSLGFKIYFPWKRMRSHVFSLLLREAVMGHAIEQHFNEYVPVQAASNGATEATDPFMTLQQLKMKCFTCFPREMLVPRKHGVWLHWNEEERREQEEAEVVPSSPRPGNDPKVIFQSHSPVHCCLSYACGKKMKFIRSSLVEMARAGGGITHNVPFVKKKVESEESLTFSRACGKETHDIHSPSSSHFLTHK